MIKTQEIRTKVLKDKIYSTHRRMQAIFGVCRMESMGSEMLQITDLVMGPLGTVLPRQARYKSLQGLIDIFQSTD